MERRRFDGAAGASDSANGGTSTRPAPMPLQPNYSCRKVQKALEHLASIDLIELCNEAKIERCRAIRDLRSCGRHVPSVLNSCGHASLCEECGQRCDICPICRIPIPKDGNKLRLRLYYECIEAGLISKRCDDRFQEKEDCEKQLTADVQRLYSLFDVAMENNLVSLICHYVTDVCLDESAVSSDPVITFLLDEVVVKDWCKRTFKTIVTELREIYKLSVQKMEEWLSSLLKYLLKLTGISNVVEILELSFKDSLAAQLHDLHHLHESVLKTKQHLEIMIWCIRHQFLQNVKSRHDSFDSWNSVVRERRSTAIKRAWPDVINPPAELTRQNDSMLFIDEALSNIDIEHEYTHRMGDEVEIACLQKEGDLPYSHSKIVGMMACYPFKNLREATDILFLHGSSDMVVAKQAIFLYHLFDRHWTMPDRTWRYIVDDFAATFGISRHSLLESFTFCLLDDHADEALLEACHLLPEISGPSTHPKVAQVLLERQNPDAALMVLRWSGRDGGTHLVSLSEAVTAVRVRVECGLLTEAFMHQRMLCTKVKEKNLRHESSWDASDEFKEECLSWTNWVEVLVIEICCLCIRRNLVDRIIDLPWNSHEEKHLHKCLLDFATDDPSTTVGSLLVMFYLQRFRYIEACQVNHKLQCVEQDFISKNPINEEVLCRMKSARHWRAGLVDRSLVLLPEVLQQQIKTGEVPNEVVSPHSEVNVPKKSDLPRAQEPILTSLLVPSVNSSLISGVDGANSPLQPVIIETPSKTGGSLNISGFQFRNNGFPVIPYANFFNDMEKGLTPQSGISRDFKFDGITTSTIHHVSPTATTPLKDLNRSSSRLSLNSHLKDDQFNRFSPKKEQKGLINEFQRAASYPNRVAANSRTSLSSYNGMFKDSAEDTYLNVSGKLLPSDRPNRGWNVSCSDDLRDIAWSHEDKGLSVEDMDANGGPRWRSDDSSEDDHQQSPNRVAGVASYSMSMRRTRRSRLTRR